MSEEWRAAKEVSDFAGEDPGVILMTSYEWLGSLELGRAAALGPRRVELSLREGLDLAPCETLWKRTPVVGGTGGGLALTVRDGVDGFVTDDDEATAARLVELVRDPGLAVEMGRAGRERVPRAVLRDRGARSASCARLAELL